MKVWILSKGGGRGQTPNPNFLLLILVLLEYKSRDGLGRLIPIFGSKLEGGEGSTKSLDEIHTLIFFLNEDFPKYVFYVPDESIVNHRI